MSQAYFNDIIQLLNEKCAILEEWKVLHNDFICLCEKGSIDFADIDAYLENSEQITDKLDELCSKVDEQLKVIRECKDTIADDTVKRNISELGITVNKLCDEITEQESKCKVYTAEFIERNRNKLGEERKSNNAAMSYYKMQNNIGISEAQFMDDKK